MCGMGRTGTLHACEQEDISPDLMAIAKGLGGGYAPIGALLVQKKIFDAVAGGSGAFQHSHTYMGHPLACAAALAVQRVMRRDNLLENVRVHGAYLSRRLKERFGNHPFVGDVRGRGLFQGLELVADRDTKAPFDPKAQAARARQARGNGARPLGLPDGRNRGRCGRRSRAAGAALHRGRGGGGHYRRTPRRRDRRSNGIGRMSISITSSPGNLRPSKAVQSESGTEVSFNQIRDEHGFECIARGENDRTREVAVAKEIGRNGCTHDPDNDRQPCFGP